MDLPLNGRDITQLMSIQAGVIAGNAQSFSEGNAFVVNGSRQNGVYYVLDTGMNNGFLQKPEWRVPEPGRPARSSVCRRAISAPSMPMPRAQW